MTDLAPETVVTESAPTHVNVPGRPAPVTQ
jgi:hypothetical protein